ncbi:PQ-loop repeat family protein / transmembrane family protein isoform X2 [Wolffia australiana]
MGPSFRTMVAPPAVCASARACVGLGLGVVSVLSWGVAEVPQIIANYKNKSTAGLSAAFLSTWILGDAFNLVGCWVEPATLPTQFYTAMLYTATTLLLAGQWVYYGHIYKKKEESSNEEECPEEEEVKTESERVESNYSMLPPSEPIAVGASSLLPARSASGNLYFVSARSLSSSPKPTAKSLQAHLRDSGLIVASIREEDSVREPLLEHAALSLPVKTKNMLSLVMSGGLFLGGLVLRHSQGAVSEESTAHGKVFLVGRKILQQKMVGISSSEGGSSGIGSFLGWAMAVIYMGGRLPQICLNIRRGTVEGLSPLMFCFALVGNATYVASILVSSLNWSKIRPNLPWLVDAAGCVLLDAFILIQFLYFHRWSRKSAGATGER